MPTRSAEALDSVLEAFEQAWRSGPPPLADYLPPPGSSARLAALVGLARIDLERRLEAGEAARVEALYLRPYPELESDAGAVLGLIRLEWELRRRVEPGLSAQELFDRFPTLRGELERLLTPAPSTVPGMVLAPVQSSALPEVPGCSVLGELGRGGMGVVYRGRDPVLGRELAVKVLGDRCAGDPDLAERFVAEAQVAGQLQHPGVVPVHALGRLPDGRPFFTMKLVKGRTLAELLAERLSPGHDLPRFVAVFESVCQAVAYAHSRGVIHRDLKPDNVMVGAFGEVQLMDWGLAKVLDRRERQRPEEQPGTHIQTVRSAGGPDGARTGWAGTPAFAAPEQARGEMDLVGPPADVFGLGAILCVVLTGEAPFAAKDAREALRLAMAGNLAGAFARLDGCGADAELVALCKDCLAAQPERRPKDAGAVAQRVADHRARVEERLRQAEKERAAAQARELEARATAEAQQRAAGAERQRRRLTVALAAAALLIVVAGGAGAWWARQQRAEAEDRRRKSEEQAQAREREAGQKALGALERGRALLEVGWREQGAGKIREARAEADRAVDVASGGADGEVRRAAADFQKEVGAQAAREEKNRALRAALLDVSVPREVRSFRREEGGPMVPAGPSVDEQYAAAFKGWGLDLDRTPEGQAAARLLDEPAPLREEAVAALAAWAVERRKGKGAARDWRKLLRVADGADLSPERRRLRALLAGALPPHPLAVAGLAGALAGAGKPLAALAPLRLGRMRSLAELRRESSLAGGPAVTLALLAQASREAGDLAGAEAVLRQALATRPDQVLLLIALGRLLEEQGGPRLAEAVGCYRAARSVRPGLGVALSRALVAGGQGQEGEAVLADLVRRQPDHPEVRLALGNLLRDLKRPAEAEKAYREALDLRPDHVWAHISLGNALSNQKKQAEAEQAYRKAIDLQPDFAAAYYSLGLILHAQKRREEAVKAYRKAIDLQPDLAGAFNNLGAVLHEQKKLDEAIRAYRKALDLQPDLAQAHYNLGNALHEQKKPDEAVRAYRKALDLRPDFALAAYNLGNSLRDLKELNEAEKAYRKALEIQPDFAWAHGALGIALREQRKPAEAVKALRKAIELRPDIAFAHANLGLALRDLKDLEEAVLAFQEANRLLPGHPGLIHDLQRTRALLRLDRKLLACLEGKDKPASPRERLLLAEHCGHYRERPRTALRFSLDAFTEAPKLAVDLTAQPRYHAACFAALAAAGKGQDAAPLSEEARAGLRLLAFAWLRADLKGYRALVEARKGLGPVVRRRLTAWGGDAALVSVRDPTALAALPEAERAAWHQFWAEVALLARASGR
jgi:tetratricopeptide (TPR) repeat protein